MLFDTSLCELTAELAAYAIRASGDARVPRLKHELPLDGDVLLAVVLMVVMVAAATFGLGSYECLTETRLWVATLARDAPHFASPKLSSFKPWTGWPVVSPQVFLDPPRTVFEHASTKRGNGGSRRLVRVTLKRVFQG